MRKLALSLLTILFLTTCKKSNTASVIPNLPTITTTTVIAITDNTAISGGSISNDGGAAITERGVCINTSANPTTSDIKVLSGNGSGSFVSNITGLTFGKIYYVRAYAINSAGTAYGNELTFTTSSGSISTATICNQIWMVKNLDVDHYRNGDPIQKVNDYVTWNLLTTGAYCYYNWDSTTYAAVYGKLYNWYAMQDPRGLAPTGWHIPSDLDWTNLENCLGGEIVAGGALKETGTTHWLTPNMGATNSSGFTGLPGGENSGGLFREIGKSGTWWNSSVDSNNNASYRRLYYDVPFFVRGNSVKIFGFSVRCLRD